jgi:dipeptidyl-peptidase-4
MRRNLGVPLVPAILLVVLSLSSAPGWSTGQVATAQVPARASREADQLTLDRLFASPEFFGEGFGPARWLEDGSYTTVERARTGALELVRYDAREGSRQVLVSGRQLVPPGENAPLRLEDYHWSEDGQKLLIFTNSRRVWRENTRGDYWVLDRISGDLFQLGEELPGSSLMFAKFSPDGGRVAFVSGNNLYVQDLESREVTQLTHDGSRTVINGTFDWVYEEEFFLRDGFRWSPDGTRIAYWQLDASGVREFLMINNTDSLYSYVIPVQYPKAGTRNSAARAGVIPADGGETVWFRLEGDPRNHYIVSVEWAEGSEEVMLQQLNRLQNTNRVFLASAATGEVRPTLTETDEAWVEISVPGRGLSLSDDLRWLDDRGSFTWRSERDGWRRVYRVTRGGDDTVPLTPANVDIMSVELVDQPGGWLYYMASPDDPTRLYLYRVPLDGSLRAERITPADQPGYHQYQMSPDARWAFHTHSSFDSPPTISLVELPGHRVVRTLVDNADLRRKVEALGREPTEFFRLDVGDGLVLDGWMMKPNDFDPSRKYPVLFHVYGEPWSQTVTDEWTGHRMLWHHLLTQQGYIVVSFDNRGTPAPRGRDWRKVVHGEVGTHAAADQANAARALARQRSYVDADRIGIWGWSGGGSQTLNSMFRHPDVFRTGMAVAPVPDQRYYDTAYQERYMGLPQDNAEGYRRGSPITYAHQLEGNLLIVHGTGDDNVHYQGTEALINRLVETGRHFTMMAYPNRSHGIFEGRGTTRHVYGLLTRYLMENLPAGPRPPTMGS